MRATSYGLLLALSAIAPAHGAVVYNESTDGDLANSGSAPTIISLGTGSNQVLGVTGSSGGTTDRDYFTFTIAGGKQLSAIDVLAGTESGGVSFLGMQAGAKFTVPPSALSATGLLGWVHYSPSLIGTDILQTMSSPSFGSSGYTPPLGAGSYSFWIQDFNPGKFAYAFDFKVTPVPLPGAALLLASGLGLLGGAASRRRAR